MYFIVSLEVVTIITCQPGINSSYMFFIFVYYFQCKFEILTFSQASVQNRYSFTARPLIKGILSVMILTPDII